MSPRPSTQLGRKMTSRARSLRRARKQRQVPMDGFIVTWDVDSANTVMCGKIRRFVFGYTSRKSGKAYHYAGLVERDGVRYLGQSVLFVSPATLGLLTEYLRREGIGHMVIEASVGPIVTN